MRAVQFPRFGGPEVLDIVERPIPTPGPGQVRVRVRAAGVNAVDAKLRSGTMQQVMPVEFPHLVGSEASGTVTAVGDGADARIGDPVLGWTVTGGYAEEALMSTWVAVPDLIDWEAAAALPVAGEAALRALARLDLRAGESLLITGAAGGVGTIAVQLAVAAGVHVVGTGSPASQARLRALGAVPTGYGPGLAGRVREMVPTGVDAVLSAAGLGALPDAVRLRGGTERVVTLADPAAFEIGVEFLAGTSEDQTVEKLATLVDGVTAGRVVLPSARVFALDDAVAAHEELDRAHGAGKIVLTP